MTSCFRGCNFKRRNERSKTPGRQPIRDRHPLFPRRDRAWAPDRRRLQLRGPASRSIASRPTKRSSSGRPRAARRSGPTSNIDGADRDCQAARRRRDSSRLRLPLPRTPRSRARARARAFSLSARRRSISRSSATRRLPSGWPTAPACRRFPGPRARSMNGRRSRPPRDRSAIR